MNIILEYCYQSKIRALTDANAKNEDSEQNQNSKAWQNVAFIFRHAILLFLTRIADKKWL